MLVYVLAVVIIFISIFCFNYTNQDLSSPSVAFTIPFGVAAINLIANIDRWDVNLSIHGVVLIIAGILSFILGCFTITLLNNPQKIKRVSYIKTDKSRKPIVIDNLVWVILTVIQIFALLYCARRIASVSRSYGYSGNILSLIGGFKRLGGTLENISLGTVGNFLYLYASTSGYIWIYLAVYNQIKTGRIEKRLVINLVVSSYIILLILTKLL